MPIPLVLGTAVVFAGVAYPVTSAALRFTSPALIATVRALAAGVIMLVVLRVIGSRLPSTKNGWTWAFAIGLGNVTITLAGISEGTLLAGAAIASVLLNSAPFFAAITSRLVLGERIMPLRAVGLVVGFAGIVVVVFAADSGGSGTNVALGVVVCLVGAWGWALAGVGMRYLSLRDPGFDVYGATTAQFLAGGLMLIPYLVLSNGARSNDWTSPKLAASLVFLIVGAQIITYVGFYVALKFWPSARVFAWTFLAPAVAVVIEAFEGQLPGVATTLGLATVITGVAIVNHPRAEAPKAEPADTASVTA